MSPKSLPHEKILTILAEAPSRIAALAAGLLPVQLRTAPGPEEWSANDVLAHLRSCADIWGSCIDVIINQDRPTLRAVNPRTWIKATDYLEQEFQASLHAFASRRTELLAILKALPPEGWSRTATVTGAGTVLERSVLSYADWMARHERPHVKQIERIVTALRQ